MRNFIFLLLLLSEFVFSQEKQSFYFDFNKSEFNDEQKNLVLNWIELHPNIKIIKIHGFCDWVGSNTYNDALALKRVNTISTIFKENKIDIQEVEIKGFGKRFEQNKLQYLNRRVDVYYDFYVEEPTETGKPIIIFTEDVKVNKLDSIIKQSKIGDKIKLKNLYFYNNSGIFVPKSKPVLAELLQVMKENPNLKIEIHGHICCQPVRPNEQVSKIRAMAVYEFLQNNGINQNRMSYKSFGSSQPVYKIPERNEEERNENRRVEILILEK